MTLIVPTAYRRNAARDRNQQLTLHANTVSISVELTCLRCFRTATQGSRCNDCRADRKRRNVGRKR